MEHNEYKSSDSFVPMLLEAKLPLEHKILRHKTFFFLFMTKNVCLRIDYSGGKNI